MKISSYFLVMASIVSFSVFATENKETDDDQRELELMASCQTLGMKPYQENANPCLYYLKGFLAAAEVVSSPVAIQQNNPNRRGFSFMSRPYRSQATLRTKYSLPFCIPEDESNERIIKIISEQFSSSTPPEIALKDIFTNALKAKYPC